MNVKLLLFLFGLCAISFHQATAHKEKVDIVSKEEISDPNAAIPENTVESENDEKSNDPEERGVEKDNVSSDDNPLENEDPSKDGDLTEASDEKRDARDVSNNEESPVAEGQAGEEIRTAMMDYNFKCDAFSR